MDALTLVQSCTARGTILEHHLIQGTNKIYGNGCHVTSNVPNFVQFNPCLKHVLFETINMNHKPSSSSLLSQYVFVQKKKFVQQNVNNLNDFHSVFFSFLFVSICATNRTNHHFPVKYSHFFNY